MSLDPHAPSGLIPPVDEHATAPIRRPRVAPLAATLAILMGGLLAFLLWAAPRTDEGISWGDPLIPGGWMAWTLATALFFWIIAALILLFLVLALRFPETPRKGVLGIETTRGDRLFITLLGSAFLNLAWLGLVDRAQWGALVLCLIFAAGVFRWA
ncbi:putative small integral membrane protein [Rubellimicrobium aerolatum]|nr:putative small integral membrane protein [Rubellimicrobium aerolatum]